MRIAARLWICLALAGMAALLVGCQTPPMANPGPAEVLSARNEQHASLYGDFELPRKLGTVENVGLQLPVVSPQGDRLLYLRTDLERVPPTTLLGSTDPQDTPAEGSLEIWLRPLAATGPGERLSRQRWAHSAVWSPSGDAVVFVGTNGGPTRVIRTDLATGAEQELGVPGATHAMPRFDGDDQTILFCAAPTAEGPFRVFRQRSGAEPVPLTPEGHDCVLPLRSEGTGKVVCGRFDDQQFAWILVDGQKAEILAASAGAMQRPGMLQMWGGIADPISPDGRSFLFYDPAGDRLSIWHGAENRLRRHRPRSIAACWLTDRAIALATAEDLFAVETTTGMSLSLFNGAWLPARYVAHQRRLILFGQATPGRLAVHEIVFKTRRALPEAGRRTGGQR